MKRFFLGKRNRNFLNGSAHAQVRSSFALLNATGFAKKERFPKRILFGSLICLLSSFSVTAAPTIKQLQVQTDDPHSARVELFLDQKLKNEQIQVDYLPDIIQLSLSGVSIYPAKIVSVNHPLLTKIFVYQYTPDLVRLRLSVKGEAQKFAEGFQSRVSGKNLVLQMRRPPSSSEKQPPSTTAAKGLPAQTESEKLLQQKVENSIAPPEPNRLTQRSADAVQVQGKQGGSTPSGSDEARKKVESGGAPKESNSRKIGSKAPSVPSLFSTFIKLFVVLLTFIGCAWIFRKFFMERSTNRLQQFAQRAFHSNNADPSHQKEKKNQTSFLGRITESLGKQLGGRFGGKRKQWIEVLSNHYLGPKKSISIVRVGQRTLVLGVTQESIQMITELDGVESDGADFDLDHLGDFLKLDGKKSSEGSSRTRSPIQTSAGTPSAAVSGIRNGSEQGRSSTASTGFFPYGTAGRASASTSALVDQDSDFDPLFDQLLSQQSDQFESRAKGQQIPREAQREPQREPRISSSSFSKSFALDSNPQSVTGNSVVSGVSKQSPSSVRAQIKSRLEGLKSL